MTHDDLIKIGTRHLRSTRRCDIVLSERGGYEIVDIIGWAKHSIMIECKVSMADYYADAKKLRTKYKDDNGNYTAGMGAERWYLTPKGLLKPEQVRPSWGLLEVRGSRVYKIIKAPIRKTYDHNNEQRILTHELQQWHIAASFTPNLSTRTWLDKCRVFEHANLVRQHKERCPSCRLPIWKWNITARESKQ